MNGDATKPQVANLQNVRKRKKKSFKKEKKRLAKSAKKSTYMGL